MERSAWQLNSAVLQGVPFTLLAEWTTREVFPCGLQRCFIPEFRGQWAFHTANTCRVPMRLQKLTVVGVCVCMCVSMHVVIVLGLSMWPCTELTCQCIPQLGQARKLLLLWLQEDVSLGDEFINGKNSNRVLQIPLEVLKHACIVNQEL